MGLTPRKTTLDTLSSQPARGPRVLATVGMDRGGQLTPRWGDFSESELGRDARGEEEAAAGP